MNVMLVNQNGTKRVVDVAKPGMQIDLQCGARTVVYELFTMDIKERFIYRELRATPLQQVKK